MRLAPDQVDTRPRIHPAGEHRRDARQEVAERGRHVGGQVRAGGVPARAVQPDLDVVRRRRHRAGAQADPTHVDRGVAVHGEDPLQPVDAAGGDDVERAAGHDLLGGLEDQSHPA